MARYIINIPQEAYLRLQGRKDLNVAEMIIANGKPIIDGEWVKAVSQNHSQAIIYDYKCSNCSHHRNKPMPYCEICGAKMDKSEESEEE